jgi:hypothetical protein
MLEFHVRIAWIVILLGFGTGALQGLCFHREDWLGGYGSWPRRLMRLGHIAFFGFAFLNLAFALTVRVLGEGGNGIWFSRALAAGAFAMPASCYLAAWKKPLRFLFYPVVTGILAASLPFALGGFKP